MTGSEEKEKAKADVETILAEFDAREDVLGAFCAKTKDLIEAILEDAKIRYHSVQQRVKSRKKVKEKYLDPTKSYQKLDDITDLAGLRVITYYEDDIDRVAEVIRQEFHIDPENSIDKRDTEPDRFGYSALNYICGHLPKRAADVEYKRFSAVRCEVQITSVLRHAWSEIEHEWYDLKDAYPKNIKRRFYRLAALLELAESEFLDLRKSKTQYQRSVAVQVEAKVPDLLTDALSLKSFIEQDALVAEVDNSVASSMGTTLSKDGPSDNLVERWAETANLVGMKKLQDVRQALGKYRAVVPEFVRRFRQELYLPSRTVPPSVTPLTRGISIHNLNFLLAGLQGEEVISKFLAAFNVTTVSWDTTRQVALAREIVSHHERS